MPRVTVVLRKSFGSAYITMNSKDRGAHMFLASTDADWASWGPHAAVEIIHRRELAAAADCEATREQLAREYREQHLRAAAAARGGFVDEVISPNETRSRLAWAQTHDRIKSVTNRVAVIGAGVAGLSAAYHLRDQAELTIFEHDARAGGHANTSAVHDGDQQIGIDTAFVVFNGRTYPTLSQWFGELGWRLRTTVAASLLRPEHRPSIRKRGV